MRHIPSVLLSLSLLTYSIGVASAQNVCIRAADGAVVCGPVINSTAKPATNPFDQPPANFTPPSGQPPATTERKPVPNRVVRQIHRDVPPPKYIVRRRPPRELERRPPKQIAREEDVRRWQADREHRPPRHFDREPPIRYSEAERRRYERERAAIRVDRDVVARRYEDRLRELEREVRALRAERERDRYAVSHRAAHRRVARDRYED